MTKPNSPFIGSVSHEVNTYGARLIHLGLAMIKGDRIPPYNYVNHKLFTAKSILAPE
jgi:ribose transport system substrate-binding protein